MNNILEQIKIRQNSHFFTTQGDRKLHYLEFGSGTNILLLIPGMGEPALKYWELAVNLRDTDHKVYVLDNFCHGLSDHALPKEHSERVYIKDFNFYIDDACDWYDLILKENPDSRINVLGHSMGGQIATCLSHHRKIHRLILSCPMFEINTKGLPKFLAKMIARLFNEYSLAPLQEEYNSTDLKLNKVTQSKKRAQFYNDLLKDQPQIKRFGVTNGWIKTALQFTENFKSICTKNIELPTLLFSAGLDNFVSSKAVAIYAQASLHREYIHLENAKHEILMEKDEIRDLVLDQIIKFINY